MQHFRGTFQTPGLEQRRRWQRRLQTPPGAPGPQRQSSRAGRRSGTASPFRHRPVMQRSRLQHRRRMLQCRRPRRPRAVNRCSLVQQRQRASMQPWPSLRPCQRPRARQPSRQGRPRWTWMAARQQRRQQTSTLHPALLQPHLQQVAAALLVLRVQKRLRLSQRLCCQRAGGWRALLLHSSGSCRTHAFFKQALRRLSQSSMQPELRRWQMRRRARTPLQTQQHSWALLHHRCMRQRRQLARQLANRVARVAWCGSGCA